MNDYSPVYDYSSTPPSPAGTTGFMIGFYGAIIILLISLWRVFEKAGRPGWNAIIPIYNIYVLLEIVKRPGWWLIWYFIPIVNIVIHFIVALQIAKAFKRSEAFAIFFLFLFPVIGFIILGFGSSKYSFKK